MRPPFFYSFLCCFALLVSPLAICRAQSATNNPALFPLPLDVKAMTGTFVVDDATYIFAPSNERSAGTFAAYLLSGELADKYGQPSILSPKQTWANNDKVILIGTIANAVIKKQIDAAGLTTALKQLGEEGYVLSVTSDRVVIAANTDKGTLWGLSSLRQLIRSESGKTVIPQLVIKDSPAFPMRGIKLYLPGKDNIPFFKRFIKDFVALYKFNTIILELNANMRLNSHPELNTAAVEFARYLSDNRLDRPLGPHREYQNSSHQDNADGQILEKQEVADLVAFMRKFNIEVIPELPSLTHSYYLLAAHKELAENTHQEYPDTYCPLKPEIYKIYFDVLDEYIDVIHPSIVHIGHDEWRMEKDLCPLCRGKDYGQLFAGDLNKIHDHLKEKGIRTAMWGDHLLESVRGKDYRVWKTSTGYEYKIPAALTAEQVTKLIPKDILIFNWFWDDIANDRQVSSFGFQQVYGNFLPEITDWEGRRKIKGLQGGAPSSWAATTEFNFGKDQLYDFLGTANLLWSGKSMPDDKLAFTIEPLIGDIHVNLSGKPLPSTTAHQVQPLDISPAANASLPDLLRMPLTLATNVQAGDHRKLMLMRGGKNQYNCIVAGSATGASSDQAVNAITVNRDVNSIIFLHACVNPARNDKAYRMIHDFDDTATLLGWYEITYEDGMIETVPIRYGVNILDWRWRQRISNHEPSKNKYSQDKYAYQASAVDCAGAGTEPVTFFCYEWLNPRLGKVVREVKLKSVARSDKGDNAIMVLAVSVATSTPSIPSTSSPRSSGQAGTSSPASSGQAGSGSPASESEEPKE